MSAIQFDVGFYDADGLPVYVGIGQSAYHQTCEHSWYHQSDFAAVVQADVVAAWAAANGEDVSSTGEVGATEYTLTDLPAPIGIPDLTQSCDSDPWVSGALNVTQAAVNVHKPAGVTRPSLWVAAGGAVITGQTDNTLTIQVPSTATVPAVSRTLVTRYWSQLARLQSRDADTSHAFDSDWPIKNKANLSHAVPASDPDHDALTCDEDVTNYDNFSYLKLVWSAMPRAGNLTLTLTYNELEYVDDPCYTCHEYRYGAEGEFVYGKGAGRPATFENDYLGMGMTGPGAQTFYVDLRCPSEGDLTRGALQHVAAISISGFPVPPSGTDVWTLDCSALELTDGPITGTGHLLRKAHRPWAWTGDWTAFSAVHDGAAILPLQYGYDQFERAERGMKHTYRRQHCPWSSATTDLSAAKTLARFAQELGWQEGFTASFALADHNARYVDDDGASFFGYGAAYWWWMKYEPDVSFPVETAATVRTVALAPGVIYNLRVRHYLQGKAHGLLKEAAGQYRIRSGGAVAVYKRADAGLATSLVGTVATDAHGRWQSAPLAEKAYSYYIIVSGGQTELGRATNREWLATDAAGDLSDPWLLEGPMSNVFRFYVSGGNIWLQQKPSLYQAWGPRRFVATGQEPVAALSDDGALRCSYVRDGAIYTIFSKNSGRSWS